MSLANIYAVSCNILFLLFSYILPHQRVLSFARGCGRVSARLFPSTVNSNILNMQLLLKIDEVQADRKAVEYSALAFQSRAELFLTWRIGFDGWVGFLKKKVWVGASKQFDHLLEESRSLILMPFHFGGFFALCARVWSCLPKHYELLILHTSDVGNVDFKIIDECIKINNAKVTLVNASDPKALRQLYFKLVKEPVVVMVYGDLGGVYGSAYEGNFFGRQARFAAGIIRMAMRANCPIVPMEFFGTPFDPKTKPRIIIYNSLDMDIFSSSGENKLIYDKSRKEEEFEALFAYIIARLENSIRQRPEAWNNWKILTTYFQPAKLIS